MAARDEQCNDRQERKDQEDMMDAVGNYIYFLTSFFGTFGVKIE